jgi:hypothetical protein
MLQMGAIGIDSWIRGHYYIGFKDVNWINLAPSSIEVL